MPPEMKNEAPTDIQSSIKVSNLAPVNLRYYTSSRNTLPKMYPALYKPKRSTLKT